ncbi:hypothetical protein RvY_05334 [Ramazzottius varieornatus]|uniref:Uncharacterized protein n=1 Tax=Ramazzottius varieornatus TaxID=947166 RepID=A0A1D1V0A2_RAMVA|nr:hypothetical protein RvY_05334 [Ramazzottius varieornatus]
MDVLGRLLLIPIFSMVLIRLSRGQQQGYGSRAGAANAVQSQPIVNANGFNSYSQPRQSAGASPGVNQNNYGSSPDQRYSNTQGAQRPPVYQTPVQTQNRQVPGVPPNTGAYSPPANEMQPQRPIQTPPGSGSPVVDFSKPNARCECYIATLASNDTMDLMDLLLPFGTSRAITTERTDITCRELKTQCIQHCKIQQESCLPDGLRTIVANTNPPASYGSYACTNLPNREEVRRPAAIFYALNAMYCKDEGYIDSLDDQYCCLNFRHPFAQNETIRLFSPECREILSPDCGNGTDSQNATSTTPAGNSSVTSSTPASEIATPATLASTANTTSGQAGGSAATPTVPSSASTASTGTPTANNTAPAGPQPSSNVSLTANLPGGGTINMAVSTNTSNPQPTNTPSTTRPSQGPDAATTSAVTTRNPVTTTAAPGSGLASIVSNDNRPGSPLNASSIVVTSAPARASSAAPSG